MLAGGKVTGGARCSAPLDPETYCAMANAGYDFIWTEHQHDARDWKTTQRNVGSLSLCQGGTGVRVAYTGRARRTRHALDAGALVLVVPTWCAPDQEACYPGARLGLFPTAGTAAAMGGGQAFALYNSVPGGYRATINDNLEPDPDD